MLKKILFAIAGLIALVLLVALFVDGEMKVEKSILIKAPLAKVWTHTNTLRAMDEWSPWNDLDPNMKKQWTGVDGTVGASQCWQGNEDAGSGCMTIARIAPPNAINVDIHFLKPFESKAQSFVRLQPEANGTTATWGFVSSMPYPFRITKLFMNMDEMIGKDYEKGLQRLKQLSEQ